MRRRDILLASLVALPLETRAQQSANRHRIAFFHPAIPTALMTETGGGSAWRAFFSELRRLGYVEGQNLTVDRYSAEGHHERYADIVREILATKPELIVTGTNPVVTAFLDATRSIPIVAFMLDPLKVGLVTSLAKPGGNLTGITLDAGEEIWEKRLQILKEAVPATRKAAFLGMREGWEGASGQVVRNAAARLGISLAFVLPERGTPSEIERAFETIAQGRPDVLLVSGEGDLYANIKLVGELTEKHRLPALSSYRDYAEAGALMAYTVDLAELLRRMAQEVDLILKGAHPGDLPIYQPTKFELLVNAKTARTLGIELPASLLARADEVIE